MPKLFAFPARFKIKDSDAFGKILRSPTTSKLRTKHCTILTHTHSAKNPKLGIIASKKNFPHAATRNALKRVARESFRLHLPQLKNLAILVLFNKNADTVERKVLRAGLDNALKEGCEEVRK